MKTHKTSKNEKGDILAARDFNHGERSKKIRKKQFKSSTRKTLKELDNE